MSLIKEERVYFHGLEEFRAIAALMVYFHHVEIHKWYEGYSSLAEIKSLAPFIKHAGSNAVTAFFVLSGFLITYLLLKEKEKTNTISVKAFYMRRIFRIWPLYFLVVFIGFAVMPMLLKTGWFYDQKEYPKLIEGLNYSLLPLFIFFLSNIALKFKPVVGASQSWSVSVEEQFYLLWPNVIKFTKGIKQLSLIIILVIVLKFILSYFIVKFIGNGILLEILNFISFQSMCVGALAAILLFEKSIFERVKKVLENKIILILVFVAILLELFIFNRSFPLSILFAIFILLIVTQKIEIKFLKFFGKISYGIYMLHPSMIFISFSIANNIKGQLGFNLAFYGLSFGLTIIASYLSFKYFESPILRFKNKYTIIKSGAE